MQVPISEVVSAISTVADYEWIFAPKDKPENEVKTTWPKWKIENRE